MKFILYLQTYESKINESDWYCWWYHRYNTHSYRILQVFSGRQPQL